MSLNDRVSLKLQGPQSAVLLKILVICKVAILSKQIRKAIIKIICLFWSLWFDSSISSVLLKFYEIVYKKFFLLKKILFIRYSF